MTPHVRVSRGRRFELVEMVEMVEMDGGYLFYDGTDLRLLAGQAAQVYARVDDVATADGIADSLAAEFPDQAPQVRADVLSFLQSLADSGLVGVLTPLPEAGYARAGGVGSVRDGDLTLLVNLDDGQRRALSPSGLRIWELACERGYASVIVAALQQEYPDAPPSLAAEVQVLLDDLVDQGFLLRGGHEPAGTAPSAL